ncbi:MAG: PAS domain-containing sensor histidine kinase [Rhodoferax sp.]
MMAAIMSGESTLLPEDEPSALVRFLQRISLVTGVVTLAVMLATVLAPTMEWSRMAAPAVLLGLLAWCHQLAPRAVRRAAATMVLGLWAVTTASVVGFAGIYSVNVLVYPYIIVLAGWMLGRRWVWAVTLATSAVLVALAWAQMAGAFSPTPRASALINLAFVLPILWVIAYLTLGGRRMLQRGRKRSSDLARQLQAQLHAVRQHEAELRLLMDNAPVGIVAYDPAWRVTRCNAHYARYFRHAPAELTGQLFEQFAPDAVRQVVAPVRAALQRGEMFSGRLQVPDPRGGPGRWVDVRAVPRIEDGSVVETLSVILDVTHAVQAEQEVRKLNAELQNLLQERTQALRRTEDHLQQSREELVRSEARATLSTLVAGVSHELGSPIGNSVLVASTLAARAHGLRQQIEQGQVSRSSMRADLDVVQESSDILLRNLRRSQQLLMQFKQVSADQASERRRRFDLREVVDDTLAAMQPTLRQYGHRVECEVPSGIVLDSYPGAVGQLVINLVHNAYLHAFAQREGGLVHIGASVQDASVVLEVRDDGQGMESGVVQRAFEPFFSTKLDQGGTGLGLSIVHHLVHKTLGGSISLQSAPGQGSVVRMLLPLRAP